MITHELVDKFTYLGSSFLSNENDINTWLAKAWAFFERLSIIWKSDLSDEIKRSFFQTTVVSILLYGCTTWTLTKSMEKKFDSNCTRMKRAVLKKSGRQHLTKQLLYRHVPPISKPIQVRAVRHAGHCRRSKSERVSYVFLWTPSHGQARTQSDQFEPICNSSVPIQDVVWKTYRERRAIGTSGMRESGKSMLAARHDDEEDL